jgi:hypothetical protein
MSTLCDPDRFLSKDRSYAAVTGCRIGARLRRQSGTYLGADLASVLDDGHNFRLLPVVGRGSVQAIADVLFLKGVDVGIVRTDTLDYLEKKGYSSNIKEQLAYITKLYNEEIHVVAAKAFRDIKDLDGKTVALDLPDGGTFVTVFERLGIKPHFLYMRKDARRAATDHEHARGYRGAEILDSEIARSVNSVEIGPGQGLRKPRFSAEAVAKYKRVPTFGLKGLAMPETQIV